MVGGNVLHGHNCPSKTLNGLSHVVPRGPPDTHMTEPEDQWSCKRSPETRDINMNLLD